MAAGPDGSLYLGVFKADQRGLVKIKVGAKPLDTRCEIVSMIASAGLDRGTGFTPWTFEAMTFAGDKVYAVYAAGQVLFDFETTTGNRTLVASSLNPKRGAGTASLGHRGQAPTLDATAMWQTGSTQQLVDDHFNLVKVDLATGDRTAISSDISDLTSADAKLQVRGSLTGNLHDATQGVWTVPGSTLLLVNLEDAIHVFDPATNTANLLSH